jgi:hypothetical protein
MKEGLTEVEIKRFTNDLPDDVIRSLKNKGADAARRALRGRLDRMAKLGEINAAAAAVIRQFLKDAMRLADKRKGGFRPPVDRGYNRRGELACLLSYLKLCSRWKIG